MVRLHIPKYNKESSPRGSSLLLYSFVCSVLFNTFASASLKGYSPFNPVLYDSDLPNLFIGNDLEARQDSTSSAASPQITPISNNQILSGSIQPGMFKVYEFTDFSAADYQIYTTGNICAVPDSDPQGINILMTTTTNLEGIKDLASYDPSNPQNVNYTDPVPFFLGYSEILNEIVFPNSGVLYVVVFTNGVETFNSNSDSELGNSGNEVVNDEFSVARPSKAAAQQKVDITAPNQNDTWYFQIGVSTVEQLHNYNSTENLFLVDTDYEHALLTSGNMTMALTQDGDVAPFTDEPFYKNPTDYYDIFVYPKSKGDIIANRLPFSYCAAGFNNPILTKKNANVSISTRGIIGYPTIQYFLNGLNISTDYTIFLTQPRNDTSSTSGEQGGIAFSVSVDFSTKAQRNCQLVYNLGMCKDTAYAVPGNADNFTWSELAQLYDQRVHDLYQGFDYSMQQVPCNNTALYRRYSILRTCEDCRISYRQWLCAVSIPRCEDITAEGSFLTTRETNTSRDSFINDVIQPGPYKEMLPCIDMCYAIVQDCPTTMGFGCPLLNGVGFEGFYMTSSNEDGSLTCNYPGAVYRANGASGLYSGLLRSWHFVVPSIVTLAMLV